jgi:hypothetical protein
MVLSLRTGIYGFNRETQEATAREWAEKQQQILSLAETLDFLLRCHRRAPFLFDPFILLSIVGTDPFTPAAKEFAG